MIRRCLLLAVLATLGCAREISEQAAELLFGIPEAPEPSGRPERLVIEGEQVAGSVDPRFVSFAIDSASLVGAPWWSGSGKVESSDEGEARRPLALDDPRLRMAVRALAPAYLRVGGTDADRLDYDLSPQSDDAPVSTLTLSRARWEALADFARDLDLKLLFTLNAGPSSRDAQGEWQPEPARSLIEHARSRGDPVAVWELGNEVNLYWQAFGLAAYVSADQYARDFARFAPVAGTARRAGPASAFWPLVGELIGPSAVLEEFLELAQPKPEVITWHYYPQQSRRCSGVVRRVRGSGLLGPTALDELARQQEVVTRARDRFAPTAEIWLGETGNAQCGGEPGVSDRYVSTLWWLDQLGLAARLGNRVVVRQTLVGSDYGLLDAENFALRPDAWGAWLWKRFMGERVLGIGRGGENAFLRAYAHCVPEGGGVSLLLINVHASRAADWLLEGIDPADARLYTLDAASLDARELRMNGEPLHFRAGRLPVLRPRYLTGSGPYSLAPASAAFVSLPGAEVPACAG